MNVQTSAQMTDQLKNLKEQRKNGEINPKQYYGGLLAVMKDLSDTLINELDHIDDAEIRTQIPLLVVILDDQIRAFSDRE